MYTDAQISAVNSTANIRSLVDNTYVNIDGDTMQGSIDFNGFNATDLKYITITEGAQEATIRVVENTPSTNRHQLRINEFETEMPVLIGPYPQVLSPRYDGLVVSQLINDNANQGRAGLIVLETNGTGTNTRLNAALNAFHYTLDEDTSDYTNAAGANGGRYGIRHRGSGTISNADGVSSLIILQSAQDGFITTADIYQSEGCDGGSSTGSISTCNHIHLQSSSGNIDNEYGIFMDDISAGSSNNYAIYTQDGTVSFGDIMQIRANSTAKTCNAGTAGGIYYDGSANRHYGCDGTTWNALY